MTFRDVMRLILLLRYAVYLKIPLSAGGISSFLSVFPACLILLLGYAVYLKIPLSAGGRSLFLSEDEYSPNSSSQYTQHRAHELSLVNYANMQVWIEKLILI